MGQICKKCNTKWTDAAAKCLACGNTKLFPDKGPHDPVERPKHYTSHPKLIECIDVIEEFDFLTASVMKYLWRAGLKDPEKELEDLKKARYYIERKIKRLEHASSSKS